MTISAIITIFPAVSAQDPPTAPSYPFIGATPNPVQVNQYVLFHVGIAQQLASTSHGWTDLSITITRPDGQIDTIEGIRTDSTGGTGAVYLPTMVGTYTAQLHFPDQEITPEDIGIIVRMMKKVIDHFNNGASFLTQGQLVGYLNDAREEVENEDYEQAQPIAQQGKPCLSSITETFLRHYSSN